MQLIRPPDIHVGGLAFYHGFFFLFFIRPVISELAKRNSTISGHRVGSRCDLKMHVRNVGYPFPLQIGGLKSTFLRRFHNLRTTLTTVYIFGMTTRYT